jgi:hypothetical protein
MTNNPISDPISPANQKKDKDISLPQHSQKGHNRFNTDNNLFESSLSKEDYIKEMLSTIPVSHINVEENKNKKLVSSKEIRKYDKHNDNSINALFTTFYVDKNYVKENLLNNDNNYYETLNYKFTIPNKKNINSKFNIKTMFKYDNSRVL